MKDTELVNELFELWKNLGEVGELHIVKGYSDRLQMLQERVNKYNSLHNVVCSADYLELAKEQFYNLKEETLDDDRHVLGAANKKDYDIDSFKFTIEVDGFWEKSTWFNWTATHENGDKLGGGTEY